MTSPDPELEPLIDALRSDLPTPDRAARLRARLVAAGIVVGGGVAAPTTAAGAVAPSTATAAKASVLSKAAALFGGPNVGLAVVVIAATAAPVAFHVATRTTLDERQGAPARQPPRSVASSAGAREEARRTADAPVPPSEPVSAPAGPAKLARPRPLPSPAKEDRGGDDQRASTAPPSVAAFPAVEKRSPESTLREEAELVDRALSALRAGDTASARALLRRHAERFPSGALVRERERALERVELAETPTGRGEPQ